jgi:hypothetical protein
MPSEKMAATPKKGGFIVHGLYAKDVLLPWDDREEFVALHSGLKAEFFPNGPSEEECVLDLAQLHWQKRTLWRLRTATVLRDRFSREIVATERSSWSGIRRALRDTASEERSLVQAMKESVATGLEKMNRLGKKMQRVATPQDAQELVSILSSATALVKKMQPLIDQAHQLSDAEGAFDKNYLPEALEKVAALESMIDARISKVLARLVALKEFKRTPAGSPLAKLTASRSVGVSGQAGDKPQAD